MQYDCFELDNASKELCTIATPFGLYRYWHLPMGVSQSPNIAQEIMERVLSSIMEEIECYINNIAALYTIKKELLSIVETLKEFQSMLLGAPITIYTDHKNLTHKLSSFSTQRILRWHIPMSRLVREKTAGPGEKNLISQPNQPQEPYKDNQACITEENPLLAKCLLVYPVFDECDVTRHPFHFATMQHYQPRSNATKQLLIDQPEQYTLE
jgi:RNase H-like domain found in reverse transcriptase